MTPHTRQNRAFAARPSTHGPIVESESKAVPTMLSKHHEGQVERHKCGLPAVTSAVPLDD